jgi:UTP--glucose-1-phosphate uridylyltransferase
MSINLAVVPVAGLGTRLLPATKSQPKEMLPVGRKPVVQYVVEEAMRADIRRILFVTGQGKTSIENHFDEDAELIANLRETGKEELLEALEFERFGVEYYYTRQRRQLGLGHAVLYARSFVGSQPFVVALGDSIIGRGAESRIISRMIDEFIGRHADAVVAFETIAAEDVESYGIARPRQPDQDVFDLADIIEKPARGTAPSCLAVAARYVFHPRIFEHLAATTPGRGGEIQLTDAIRAMIRGGGRVVGVRLAPHEKRYDIGNFDSYFRAFCEFALADPKHGPGLAQFLKTLR